MTTFSPPPARPSKLPMIDQLAKQLIAESDGLTEHHWIGLAGPPGSGKSTIAAQLKAKLAERIIVIPMDGYHYYRHELDDMPDPELAHSRRGAPFTFNAQRFVEDLKRARISGQGTFPEFSHGQGDPVEGAIQLKVKPARIILVEGNYLLLEETPWRQLKDLVFHETWFVDVPIDVCRKRVYERHICVGRTPEAAQKRVDHNDGPNAEFVIQSCRHVADRLIAN